MKSWYTIKAQGESSVEIDIFDEIGFWGISAKDFLNDLKKYPDAKEIQVRINSYGGEVFDGLAIYNALKRHPANVTIVVYGIAASIASVIAMAGDKIVMPENTFLFIHDPLALVMGDADDMRDMAEALDKIASGLIASYVSKSGKEEKQVKKWMAEDTWFTAAEALDLGLADEVTTAVRIAASGSLNRFKNLPDSLRALGAPPAADDARTAAPPSAPSLVDEGLREAQVKAEVEAQVKAAREEAESGAREILALCAKAGVPEAATTFLDKGMSVEDVKNRLANADKIRARCASANLAERANRFIAAGFTLEEVSHDLLDILLARQGPEIDNSFAPGATTAGFQRKPLIDYKEIYDLRRHWAVKK